MIHIVLAVITAALAVFTIGASITAALAGYPIGWVMLSLTLIISYILFVDGIEAIKEDRK